MKIFFVLLGDMVKGTLFYDVLRSGLHLHMWGFVPQEPLSRHPSKGECNFCARSTYIKTFGVIGIL